MDSSELDRAKAVKRALANGALEGMQADPEFRMLLDRYIAGQLTLEQALEITRARFTPGTLSADA